MGWIFSPTKPDYLSFVLLRPDVLYDSNTCMYPNTVYHTYVVQAYVEVVELEKKSHMQLIRVSHLKVSKTKDHHHNNNDNNNTQSQPIITTVVPIDEHGNTSVLNENNDNNAPKERITQEENNTPHLTMMSK